MSSPESATGSVNVQLEHIMMRLAKMQEKEQTNSVDGSQSSTHLEDDYPRQVTLPKKLLGNAFFTSRKSAGLSAASIILTRNPQ